MTLTQDDKMNLYFVLIEAHAHAEYDRKHRLSLGLDLKGDQKRLDRVTDLLGKIQTELFGQQI